MTSLSISSLLGRTRTLISLLFHPTCPTCVRTIRPFAAPRRSINTNNESNITSKVGYTVDFYSISKDGSNTSSFGKYNTIASTSDRSRDYFDFSGVTGGNLKTSLSASSKDGRNIWVRGRVHSVRAKGNSVFVILRKGMQTFQVCYFKDKQRPEESKAMLKFLGELTTESIIDVSGKVSTASVKSCSINDFELVVSRAFVVSTAPVNLPFTVEDASRSLEEIEASIKSNPISPYPHVHIDTRLDNRWLDLRVPAHAAIMKIKGAVLHIFRNYLYNNHFTEIITPKILGGESEGGADVFRLDYFGRKACLAQSPQLYKQMMISADFRKVFEIGPVFRAENSRTKRHMCEFTGLDIEMEINEHYNEVLRALHGLFVAIFTEIGRNFKPELALIRSQYPLGGNSVDHSFLYTDEPVIIHWPDAIELLRSHNIEADLFTDLSSAQESALGEIVKKIHKTDIFVVDQYPSNVRPFYTMVNTNDKRFSNSYDIFIRGQEICSGAQRQHNLELLVDQMNARGITDLTPFKAYLDSFSHGISPHAGAGIGLERLVALYLGLDSVKKASLFPRDPGRCTP